MSSDVHDYEIRQTARSKLLHSIPFTFCHLAWHTESATKAINAAFNGDRDLARLHGQRARDHLKRFSQLYAEKYGDK